MKVGDLVKSRWGTGSVGIIVRPLAMGYSKRWWLVEFPTAGRQQCSENELEVISASK